MPCECNPVNATVLAPGGRELCLERDGLLTGFLVGHVGVGGGSEGPCPLPASLPLAGKKESVASFPTKSTCSQCPELQRGTRGPAWPPRTLPVPFLQQSPENGASQKPQLFLSLQTPRVRGLPFDVP